MMRKIVLQGVCLWIRSRFYPGFSPDPGDPKRPGPDPQYWLLSFGLPFVSVLVALFGAIEHLNRMCVSVGV